MAMHVTLRLASPAPYAYTFTLALECTVPIACTVHLTLLICPLRQFSMNGLQHGLELTAHPRQSNACHLSEW